MSNKSWHTGLDPKIQGCWNLHNAIKGKDAELDFFFMTSSVSGSIGQTAQANYCSANHFLDMFSRHRRAQGLPAIVVGFGMISDVGYLHENPDIEAILARTGISALDEDELLQILDIALSTTQHPGDTFDSFSQGHILTGMESSGYEALREKGIEVSFPAKNDPRTSLLQAALEKANASASQDDEAPEEDAAEEGQSPQDAATGRIKKQLSQMLTIQVEKIDDSKNLAAFGMDSMLATEFRTWFFQTFKIDVPFNDLLESSTSISTLSGKVAAAA